MNEQYFIELNGYLVKDRKAIHTYDNVASMKSDTNLKAGMHVKTKGYYNINDGGNAEYIITDTEDLTNFQEELQNDLYATLIVKDKVNVKQLGAKGDNINNDITPIQTSLNLFNYAYLPKGIYKIDNTITIPKQGSLYGNNLNETIINYTGSNNAIQNEDISDCIEINIHDITLNGTNKTGNGIYLYRNTKNGDAYHQIEKIKITNFENGIYATQYQNETKFLNLDIALCKTGLNFDHLNDCYVDNVVTHQNEKDGILVIGSSEIRFNNIKSWYNGSNDPTNYSNLNIRSSAAININNITSQESYGDNIILSYNKNIMIDNCYLSWPGLGNPSEIHQVYLDENVNCFINATTQNGHFNESEITNYVLALKNHPNNCTVNITTEDNFPVDKKMILIGANNNGNAVFNRNIFNIIVDNLKINKENYAKNGDIANTTDLSYVNNNTHCSYVNGKLRVDTTGESGNTFVYFKLANLPRNDFYTTYMKFNKVSGSGQVLFENPGYATVGANDPVGTTYYVGYTKYRDISLTANQTLSLIVQKDMIIDIEEFGLTLGESGLFNLPLNSKAKI